MDQPLSAAIAGDNKRASEGGCKLALHFEGTCRCVNQPADYVLSCEHFVPGPYIDGTPPQGPPQGPRLMCVKNGDGLLLRMDASRLHQDVELNGEQALRLALSLLSEALNS